MSDKKLDYLNTALNVHQSATLESIKKQNQTIVDHQAREADFKNRQNYLKAIVFDASTIVDKIENTDDIHIKCFFRNEFYEGLQKSVNQIMNELNEINDKKFCYDTINRLKNSLTVNQQLYTDFAKSELASNIAKWKKLEMDYLKSRAPLLTKTVSEPEKPKSAFSMVIHNTWATYIGAGIVLVSLKEKETFAMIFALPFFLAPFFFYYKQKEKKLMTDYLLDMEVYSAGIRQKEELQKELQTHEVHRFKLGMSNKYIGFFETYDSLQTQVSNIENYHSKSDSSILA